ncbi:hypothetical protein ACFVAJ_16485 [Agromyces sp. NPDC057679]|uniref:hypothetical protein n=1 Tax=Agromyces sp. NPDC057679 TaxID=3346207 RepID=UPI0036728AF8
MSLYSLTHLTGRKRNVDRKIIVLTVEANKASFIVTVISVGVSILPTVILYMIIGSPALVIMPTLFAFAGWWLFRYRSKKGLQLPMYRLLLDRGRAKQLRGKALVCGVPMSDESAITKIVSSSVPADRLAESAAEELTPVYGQTSRTNNDAPRHDIFA